MFAELTADSQLFTQYLRATHEICERHNDVATASLIEVWIDQSERRIVVLFRKWFWRVLSVNCGLASGMKAFPYELQIPRFARMTTSL